MEIFMCYYNDVNTFMKLYLDPNWKKIGISISGGVDSALLSYLICSNTNAEIHFNKTLARTCCQQSDGLV